MNKASPDAIALSKLPLVHGSGSRDYSGAWDGLGQIEDVQNSVPPIAVIATAFMSEAPY